MSVDDVSALETEKGVLMAETQTRDEMRAAMMRRRTRMVSVVQRTNKPCWTYIRGAWWRYNIYDGNLTCDGCRQDDGYYVFSPKE